MSRQCIVLWLPASLKLKHGSWQYGFFHKFSFLLVQNGFAIGFIQNGASGEDVQALVISLVPGFQMTARGLQNVLQEVTMIIFSCHYFYRK